jgi:hypothetical protein
MSQNRQSHVWTLSRVDWSLNLLGVSSLLVIQVIKKYPTQSSSFSSVFDEEVVIAPLFEIGMVFRVMAIAHLQVKKSVEGIVCKPIP